MAQTIDLIRDERCGTVQAFPVAEGENIPCGAIVALLNGFAYNATAATGLSCPGIADARADNTDGLDGDINVMVRLPEAVTGYREWKFANATAGNAILASHVGDECSVLDNQTVAIPDAGRSNVGRVMAVESDGVWVRFYWAPPGADGADGDATAYTPGDGADWTDPDPTTLAGALDRIAAAAGPIA